MPANPLLLILAAPSGGGKSTLAKRLLAATPNMRLSVSHTTRTPRQGELDGRDYHFVSDEVFDRMVAEGAFAEWFPVHAHRYGTAHSTLRAARSEGYDLLLDVDVLGATALRKAYPEACSVFIVPPSMDVLAQRLRRRGTDDEEIVQLRLGRAGQELACAAEFDYVVVNDDLDQAAGDLLAVVRAARCSPGVQAPLLRALQAAAPPPPPNR